MTQMLSPPPASEVNAISVPSGENRGCQAQERPLVDAGRIAAGDGYQRIDVPEQVERRLSIRPG